jgi:hypothetical protein
VLWQAEVVAGDQLGGGARLDLDAIGAPFGGDPDVGGSADGNGDPGWREARVGKATLTSPSVTPLRRAPSRAAPRARPR